MMISEEYNKATILVIGDQGTGKTTFLREFCNESKDKKLKTSSKINIFIKKQTIRRSYTSSGKSSEFNYYIEFVELCGEKPYKDAMAFYVNRLYLMCSAIVFFFDLTNKKSLFNFYMWLKFLIEAWDCEKESKEHPLWQIPFLICAEKSNLLQTSDVYKSEIEDYFRGLFGNQQSVMNVLFLGSRQQVNLNLAELFLVSFLDQICIDLEIKKLTSENKKPNPEEDILLMELTLMKGGEKSRFCLNKEVVLKNLFINTFAKETVANLYWQFVNQLLGYYRNMQRLISKKEGIMKLL